MEVTTRTEHRGRSIVPITSYGGFDIVRSKNARNPDYWEIEKDGVRYSSIAVGSVERALEILKGYVKAEVKEVKEVVPMGYTNSGYFKTMEKYS